MNTIQQIRVLIADDHAMVREGIAALIARCNDMCVVGEARTGSEAVSLYVERRPDVTLMDLRMPEMDGIGAIEAIRRFDASARVLILSSHDGDEDVFRGLQVGALGYLLKDMSKETLVAAIRAVRAGQRYIPPAVAAKLAERLGNAALTQREIEVLERIAAGRSNKEVADDLGVVEGTVKAHMTNILVKLNAADRTQAVTIAIRRGILQME